MLEDFYAIPTRTTYSPIYSPFSPISNVHVGNIITPILPAPSNALIRTNAIITNNAIGALSYAPKYGIASNLNFGVNTVYNPNSLFYYDSGIGENPIANHETNTYLRYKFLDKWLYENYPEILRMLKVGEYHVEILSKNDAEKNDISNDTSKDLEKKSDFIGREILTLSKNKKILTALCVKNNLKFYDLPHNEHYVRKAQAKYIIKHLEEKKG